MDISNLVPVCGMSRRRPVQITQIFTSRLRTLYPIVRYDFAMGTASGKYTTVGKTGGIECHYELTWECVGTKALWSARVRVKGGAYRIVDGELPVLSGFVDVQGAVLFHLRRRLDRMAKGV
jgi:hypothetical protein